MRTSARLGSILRRDGVISAEQLEEALARHQESGHRLGEVLLSLGYASDSQIGRALAEQIEVPFVDLEEHPPGPLLLRRIPVEVARRLQVVPAAVDRRGRLVVAAANPCDFHLDTALRQAVREELIIGLGIQHQIDAVLENYEQRTWYQTGPARPATPAAEPQALRPTAVGARLSPDDLSSRAAAALAGGFGELKLTFDREGLSVTAVRDGSYVTLGTVAAPITLSIQPGEATEAGQVRLLFHREQDAVAR